MALNDQSQMHRMDKKPTTSTYNNVFERLVNDLVVIRQTVELHCFQIQVNMMSFLYTVRVCVRLEASTYNVHKRNQTFKMFIY